MKTTPCPTFHCDLPANHAGPCQCAKVDCAVNPPRADYNEMLISQAGGAGEPERTKDFTERELFAVMTNPYTEPEKGYECWECGAAVINTTTHTDWHNKLLP